MESYEHKNERIASLCESNAPAPAHPDPPRHTPQGILPTKAHCYRAPCYHRNSFHSKNLAFTMDSSKQLGGGGRKAKEP